MPIPLLLIPLIKGTVIAVKATIAANKTAVVAKTVVGMTHTVGTATTLGAIGATLTTIGLIEWTSERYGEMNESYNLWCNGDRVGAVKKFGSMCSKIASVHGNPQGAIHSGLEILKVNGANALDVARFGKDLSESIDEIDMEIKKRTA